MNNEPTRRPRPAPTPESDDDEPCHHGVPWVNHCKVCDMLPQDSAPAAPPIPATPGTTEPGEGAGGGDPLQAKLVKARQRIAELEKGITDIKAGTRIGWFMTDLGAKCSKLLNQ